MTPAGLGRRQALTGAATVGVGVPLLAACGDDAGTASGGPAASPPADGTATQGPGGSGDGAVLASTSEVAVGGGAIFAEQKVVVTQPAAGEFRAFSSTCTHQGCQVAEVADGTINCPCHASQFSIEDGSVQSGPASSPLPGVDITVRGDAIRLM